MSLRDLSTPSMLTLSGAWLDAGKARGLIEALPAAAALLPSLEDAHRRIVKTQAKPSKASPALVAIRAEQEALDVTHDRCARGTYTVLTAFADLTADPEAAASYLALRDKIFLPQNGLRVIQASYGDESSEAVLVEQRLDDADRALLKKLPTPDGKLFDAHKARISAAAKLGKLDRERIQLEHDELEKDEVKQADVLKARNGWIQAVRALVTVIDLVAPSAAIRNRILGPLEEAEKKAGRRGAKPGPDAAVEPGESAQPGENKPQ